MVPSMPQIVLLALVAAIGIVTNWRVLLRVLSVMVLAAMIIGVSVVVSLIQQLR
jgi:hypothetical protein